MKPFDIFLKNPSISWCGYRETEKQTIHNRPSKACPPQAAASCRRGVAGGRWPLVSWHVRQGRTTLRQHHSAPLRRACRALPRQARKPEIRSPRAPSPPLPPHGITRPRREIHEAGSAEICAAPSRAELTLLCSTLLMPTR